MAATIATAISQVLENFQTATDSALQGLPSSESILPPENGITLLDAKNEIFLSYLQALALRNLNVLRCIKDGSDAEDAQRLSNDISKQLVEQRVYLERGVRVLEQKIKYQVDRVVRVADDEERTDLQRAEKSSKISGEDEKGEGSEDDTSDDEDDEQDRDADLTSSRPNLKSMRSEMPSEDATRTGRGKADGVYRPPRISATAMPTIDKRERAERKPMKSRTLDEYVSTELSAAPLAQPSIGSNIAAGGRNNKSARQLREEAERRDYEESNLVRLPAMSKKEKARKGYGRERDGGFGGEEWRDLGKSIDRIGDLTRKKNKESVADKGRKRARAVEDGPRGDGSAMGGKFEIKKRRMMKKGQI